MTRFEKTLGRPGFRMRLSAAAMSAMAGCAWVPMADAFEIETPGDDLKLRLDTQLRYAVGVRGEKINPAFGNSPTYDETEYRFERGDVMMNRLDLLSEFDAVYQNRFGARVSAAAWYDHAYRDGKAHTNPGQLAPGLPYSAIGNYAGNDYSPATRRFHRGSGELLDAFVFSNFEIGSASANVRLGKHTVYWGESLFTSFHGIAYSQAPLDGLKGASSPGIEAKEVFMPINQVSAAVQFSSEWSLRGQYFLAWRPNRLPQGGTYFGVADMLFDGPDRLFAGAAGQIPRGASVEPDRGSGNNFGLNLRYSPSRFSGTTFGLYYRQFDETQPWAPVFRVAPPAAVPADYHLAYARDTRMIAVSLSTAAGPVSVGSDLVYRRNTALNSGTSFAAAGDFAGREGARGNTFHWVVNGVYLLPRTALWESGTLVGELVYSRLGKVTRNSAVFKGAGYGGCTDAAGTAGAGTKDDGCATGDVLLMQVAMTPQWLGVFPGVDLAAPISLSYGLHGNGATLGGGNEGAAAWSIGLEADVHQKYKFGLRWNDSTARYNTQGNGLVSTVNGNAVQRNHGWLALTFKTSF